MYHSSSCRNRMNSGVLRHPSSTSSSLRGLLEERLSNGHLATLLKSSGHLATLLGPIERASRYAIKFSLMPSQGSLGSASRPVNQARKKTTSPFSRGHPPIPIRPLTWASNGHLETQFAARRAGISKRKIANRPRFFSTAPVENPDFPRASAYEIFGQSATKQGPETGNRQRNSPDFRASRYEIGTQLLSFLGFTGSTGSLAGVFTVDKRQEQAGRPAENRRFPAVLPPDCGSPGGRRSG